MIPENDKYYSTWRNLKRDQRILVLILIAFYPILEFVIRPLYNRFDNDWIFHGFGLVWLLLFFIYFVRALDFKCPKCQQSFSEKWYGVPLGYIGFRGKQCVHCGLEKWILSDLKTKYDGA
jgi:hypothetical protein